jgi:hypothetical protein
MERLQCMQMAGRGPRLIIGVEELKSTLKSQPWQSASHSQVPGWKGMGWGHLS